MVCRENFERKINFARLWTTKPACYAIIKSGNSQHKTLLILLQNILLRVAYNFLNCLCLVLILLVFCLFFIITSS